MTQDRHSSQLNRREFLTTASAATLGVAGMVKSSAASTEANSKLVAGVIGLGGQGTGLMNHLLSRPADVKIDAVCDVWTVRRDGAAGRANCRGYMDYRRVLDRNDIDVVVIATPDHWHARISMEAMEAGKDIYCEKPMTLTWQEAKEVAAVAKRTGRVYQCGAQSASGTAWWKANELIRKGAIGKVIWSQGGYCRNNPGGDWNYPIHDTANPGNLDWDMWLGPAPKRPWSPERYFRFRKFWDYSGGLATDLLYHALAHLEVALTPEFPVEVSAMGGNYVHAERDVPDTYHTLIKYPTNHTVFLASTQENHNAPADTIRGQYGTLYFSGNRVDVSPQVSGQDRWQSGILSDGEIMRNEQGGFHGVRYTAHGGEDHVDNWLRCVRTRELPNLNADTAYKVMVAIHLGVLSYRLGKTMHFDPEREEVIG